MDKEAYKALQTGVLRSFTWEKGLIALAVLVGFVIVAKLIGHLLRKSLARHGRGGGATFALSKLLPAGPVGPGRTEGDGLTEIEVIGQEAA